MQGPRRFVAIDVDAMESLVVLCLLSYAFLYEIRSVFLSDISQRT